VSDVDKAVPVTSRTRPAETHVRRVETGSFEDHLVAMGSTPGARLADFFGAIEDGGLVLRLVYALDDEAQYEVVEWPVSGPEYPALSESDPAAFVEECEIYEQFGVSPAGGRLLNRLVVSRHASPDFPRLGAAPPRPGREVHAQHYVTGEAFEFPVGPVRAVAQESLYMGLVTSGEEVIDLYLLQWHKHRGIERRLQGLSIERALFIVERAEGPSAVANTWAFCRSAEALCGLALPEPVEAARAVALELERLYNHAAAIAALCQSTGLSVGQAQAEIALEGFLRLNLASFGHRYLFGSVAFGEMGRSLDREALLKGLPVAYDELRRVTESLWSTNSFMDRLEACGTVDGEAAGRLGLVGPVARAAGRDLDTRRDHPFGPFGQLGVKVAVRQKGDALARMQVMAAEAEESVRLVHDLAGDGARAGPRRGSAILPDEGAAARAAAAGPGAALGWCESPRGESLAWLSLDAEGLVRRARLRPASARNWRAFDDAARSRNVFTDIPIIEASFWLTVAGFAR